jgi:hypothetical protein
VSIAVICHNRALGVGQPPDEEAVDADQLAGPPALDPRLGLGLARRLIGGPVAGDQLQPPGVRLPLFVAHCDSEPEI